MSPQESLSKPIVCRYCQQPIHPKATKCQHCGEHLSHPSPAQRFTKKIVGLIGITTALLSLFYALKEGYFYIEQRQQQREMFAAHMNAAEHFLKLDNLEYAEASLNQAIQLNPNDQQLRLRHFFLRSRNLLREVDYYGAQLPEEHLNTMPDLVTSGFSLIDNDFTTQNHAQLLITLARLLQYDKRWQSPAAIDELFAKAHSLAPTNADIAYWYGEWLVNQETNITKGIQLIQEATELDPENALYIAGLGRQQAKQENYAAAFVSLKRAIELDPKQHELQRVRAANESKYTLRRALLSADSKIDITSDDFFGMDTQARMAIVEFTLQHSPSERNFRRLAARLFNHAGQQDKAEPIVRELLGEYNERSDIKMLTLFADILKAQNNNEEAAKVQAIMDAKQQRDTYEEMLETSIEDGHRYKVGLKVAKQNEGDGILVIKAFDGYPFAKAGVKPGDKLLQFAHRNVTSLRSIWVPINDFTPGTDVPLKIQRDSELLTLTVVIE